MEAPDVASLLYERILPVLEGMEATRRATGTSSNSAFSDRLVFSDEVDADARPSCATTTAEQDPINPHHAVDMATEKDVVGSWCRSGLNSDLLFAVYPFRGSFAPHTDGKQLLTTSVS